MRITDLELENFRGFKKLHLQFDPNQQTHVLVGINGSGKTSILDAIAMLLMHIVQPLTSNSKSYKNPFYLTDDDIQIGAKSTHNKFTINFLEQNTLGFIKKEVYSNKSAYAYENFKTLVSFLNEHLLNNAQFNLPILVYYQSNRHLISPTSKKKTTETYNHEQFYAYKNAFSAQKSDFSTFLNWFINEENFENQEKIVRQDFTFESKNLSTVRSAVKHFLEILKSETFSSLRIKRQRNGHSSFRSLRLSSYLVISKDGQELTLDQLSDGEKSLLLIVGDIAHRLAIANPSLEQPLNGEGIVLIDELELHLHPQWQRLVVAALEKTFPKLQFIVTTHSPQVLSSVKRAGLFILKDFQLVESPPIYGRDSNSILYEAMEVEKRPRQMQAKINQLFELIDDETKRQEAKKLMDELMLDLGENDPDIQHAQSVIDFLYED